MEKTKGKVPETKLAEKQKMINKKKVTETIGFCQGNICEKTAGLEKGEICVIVGKEADNLVLIDGNVRRRKCNIAHLKLLEKTLKIKTNASTKEIKEAMRKADIEVKEKIKLKERLRNAREQKREIKKEPKKKQSKVKKKGKKNE